MTVESSNNKSGPFIASGATGVFPRNFLVFDPAHVRVVRSRDGVETDITTGISHSGMGSASGTVTLSQGIQSGDRITLLRNMPNVQRSDYSAQSSVPTEQVELDLDLLAMQVQDLAERQARALTLPVDSTQSGEEAMRAALAAPQYALQAKEAANSVAATAALLVNVRQFGAIGDGVANDTAAFQAAIQAVGNGQVLVPPGAYKVAEVLIQQGTMLICSDANGEVSTNANGTASGNVKFIYGGTGGPDSFMFRWRADAPNAWLFGGGILGGPVLNGSNLCATGIHAASTVRQRFDVEMRNFTYAGIRLGSDNGVLSVGCSVNLKFTYGASAAVENCHGVFLTGEAGNAGCTQHDIKTHGLVKHGDMVRLVGNCDNNRLTIHASKGGSQSGATGNALSFYDGATKHPRNNTIYDIAGPIYSSGGAFGNVIVRGTSEGTKVFGSGQLHINRMVDYVNGKMYSTPAFPLFERREIPASQGVVIGGASLGVVAGVGAGVICADDVTSGAVWTIPGGNWTRGKIRRVRIKYSCVNASAAANVRFRVEVAVTPMGQGFASDYGASFTEPGTAAGSARVAEVVILDASNLDMVEDALVSVSVERLGADALDTATGNVRIHAVEVDFAAFGPEHSYTAPVAYPDFRRVKQ